MGMRKIQKKDRDKSITNANFEHQKFMSSIENASGKEKIEIRIAEIKNVINLSKSDLENPQFCNNENIKYKLKIAEDLLIEKQKELENYINLQV